MLKQYFMHTQTLGLGYGYFDTIMKLKGWGRGTGSSLVSGWDD